MLIRLPRLVFASLLCALALGATAARAAGAAGAPHDAFLQQLAGHWNFDGTLLDKPVHHHGHAHWVLNESWLCLDLVDTGKPPAYQASVYFGADAKAGDYIAHWLDQFGAAGARIVGSGQREGQTLLLLFPYADGNFRDTLTLAPDGRRGTLLIESQGKDGSWSTFASYILKKTAR